MTWGNRRVRKAVYKITYKRRYWNGSAYVLESSSRTIHRREIDRISAMVTKFDVPLQNRILPSNVSIVLKDKTYKWLPSNTASGVWRRDGTATVGYDPVGSEFTIHYGYVTDTDLGTEEYLAMFTGLILDDPKFDSNSGTVTISLVGKAEAKLEAADAQKVGVFVDDGTTSPATGDGSNLTFSTQKTSLWRVRTGTVRVNGVAQTQGTHYTLDNLNDAEIEASIVFETGFDPGVGEAVLFDGDQWYRNTSISDLVGYLCDQAGIASGDREIEEPIFSGVDQSNTWTDEADWDAFTKTNMDSDSRPGWLVIGEKLRGRDFDTSDDLDFWTQSPGSGTISIDNSTPYDGDGCLLYLIALNGSRRFVVSLIPSVGTTITTTVSPGNTWTQYSLTAGSEGPYTMRISFQIDTVEKGRVDSIDTIVSSGTKVSFWLKDHSAIHVPEVQAPQYFYVDKVRAITATGSATSAEVDMLAVPTEWIPMDLTYETNDGTITFKTQVSNTSGAGYDAAVALDGTNTPQSALKRYVKFIVEVTCNADQTDGPEIDLAVLRWRGSNLFVKSADFTGLTCLQAVQELAKLGGMEFGTAGDGTFFFRNKAVSGSADMELSQKNAIVGITDYSLGYRDVKNVAQVRYGKSGTDGYYFAEYAADDASEASPTTAERFGEKVITIDIQRLIFANDASVATAIARKLYELNYAPKRKLKLKCRIIPQLDLSDKVQVSFHDSPLIEQAIFGDPFLKGFPPLGPNPKTLARDILMKVVGHSPDLIRSESVLDLEEVLA